MRLLMEELEISGGEFRAFGEKILTTFYRNNYHQSGKLLSTGVLDNQSVAD